MKQPNLSIVVLTINLLYHLKIIFPKYEMYLKDLPDSLPLKIRFTFLVIAQIDYRDASSIRE